MIKVDKREEVFRLLDSGLSVPQVSKQTTVTTTTIYRWLDQDIATPLQEKAFKIPKDLVNFIDYLNSLLKKGIGSNHSKMYSELKKAGYAGSYGTLNRYLNKKFPNKNYRKSKKFYIKHSKTADKLTIRFETKPGQQAQVDWAYFGKIEINGRIERLYCFVYLLGWSRMRYIEFTVRQNLQTLLECHIHAFEKLGIPHEIVYDNMKAVVTKRTKLSDNTENIEFNLVFAEFAKHYGFNAKPHWPYHPQSKGKVERAIKYVRDNFWPGIKVDKGTESLEELNRQGELWLENEVHPKPNDTTHEKPFDRFRKEKKLLRNIADIPLYETATIQPVYSSSDGLIEYQSNSYPVPIVFARKKLYIKVFSDKGIGILEVYCESELIAKYFLSYERYQWIKPESAIFFKEKFKQKVSKSLYRKSIIQNSIISPRPLSDYDQLIPGGKI